jgi:hypothetical protein
MWELSKMDNSIIRNLLEITGLGIFIWLVSRGMYIRLTSLEKAISVQKETISAFQKATELYKDIAAGSLEIFEKQRNLLQDIKSELPNETKEKTEEIELMEKDLGELEEASKSILMLDIGSNAIGWAMCDEQGRLESCGTRIMNNGSSGLKQRVRKSMRRRQQ